MAATETDLFKLLFDTVDDGLAVCDADGRYVAANAGLHRMLGYAPGVGSSRVDLQACKLEYSIVSPK